MTPEFLISPAQQAHAQPAAPPPHLATVPRSRLDVVGPPPVAPAPREQRKDLVAPLLEARRWSRFCRLLDLSVLCAASAAAVLGSAQLQAVSSAHWLAFCFPAVVLAVLHLQRSDEQRLKGSLLAMAGTLLWCTALAALLVLAAQTTIGGGHPVLLAGRLLAFCGAALVAERAILLSVRSHALRVPGLATPTLIIGAGQIGEHLVKRLQGDPAYGLRPVGFLDSEPLPPAEGTIRSVPVMGGARDLQRAIAQTGAMHVILAFSSEPDSVMLARVRECERLGVTVSLVPRLFESINERAFLDHVGGLPVITLRHVSPRGWQFTVKHAFDKLGAGLALLLLSPLMLAIALLVALSSPGPVFYRQRRVGRDGQVFDLLKFRTMRAAPAQSGSFEPPAGGGPGGSEGMDRTTGIGRWLRALSLDELPQFINVLRGDMSVVGPRPERPEYVERFTRDVSRYEDRHRVKSGITGWAQAHGLRGNTSIADRVEWDNFYIQNWSLWLDARILLMTVREVARATLRDLTRRR